MPSKTERKRIAQLKAAGKPVPPPKLGKGKLIAADAQKSPEKPVSPGVPTGQRQEKDKLVKERSPLQEAGKSEISVYRSPPPIERLRNRGSLDHSAGMNEAMYQEALELQRLHRKSGLGGIAAQDLSRLGGGGDPAHLLPLTAQAAHDRRELLRRLNAMGWHASQPLRGAGRVTFAVVCDEMSFADAGRIHCGVNETERAAAVAKDRLREGLMMLVDLSRKPKEDQNKMPPPILGHPQPNLIRH